MAYYVRDKRLTVDYLEDNLLFAKGSMNDNHHDIELLMKIRLPEKEIVWAESRMDRIPHPGRCEAALKLAQGLVGLRIERGVIKRLQKGLGGESGCVHIVALAIDLIQYCAYIKSRPEAEAILRLRLHDQGEFHKLWQKDLAGTCVTFPSLP